MRLRERLPVLWQEPTQVRIGTDPRWSVVLSDLGPGAVRALMSLPQGAPERSLRAALRSEDVPDAEASALVAHLTAAHLLVSGPPRDFPDAAVLSLLESDGWVDDVRAGRAAARVRVCGLGRLGASLVRTLATAGVGHLELDDPEVVGRNELGWAGLVAADLGRPRTEAVARAAQEVTDAVFGPPESGDVDLVILVEHGVSDPTRHRPLLTDGTCHLSVVVREASVLVGPLVHPGVTPCLRCVDLHRTDVDPHWPTIAAQLAVQRAFPEETVLATVGASLAAAQALAWVDGRASALAGAALEVRLPDAVPRSVTWPAHPECGCTALP